jgi:hypothetical protein
VKLGDAARNLCAASLKSLADLPTWRPIYLDLRELTASCTLDLANVTAIEIAVTRCADCEVFDVPGQPRAPEEHAGILFLDELGAVDLGPGAPHRQVQNAFEAVTPNPAVAARAALALLSALTALDPETHAVPAWFTEPTPNFDTYAQAEALLVFVYEYERTGHPAYREAARSLARTLIGQQIPAGLAQAGAWFTSHRLAQGALRPPARALPRDAGVPCDGNETMVPDPGTGQLVAANLDTCEWLGNVGWVLIALGKLQRVGWYDDPAALQRALDDGAAWIAGQSEYRGSPYPDLITFGIEGNISAYFGLLAAGRVEPAARLGNAIFQFGWDPAQRRMKAGVTDAATALDVTGSWGATFLRALGKAQEALDAQGYAASVLRTTSFDGTIVGYGDIAGPFTVAVEFTAQAAAAGILGAELVMQQLYSLQRTSAPHEGAFPGATDHWYGGQLPPWNTTMPGVSPTAWVYFAANRDPLRDIATGLLTLHLNQTSFQASQTMVLSVALARGPSPQPVDAYIAVQVPGGGLFSLRADGSIVPGIQALATGIVPFPVSGELVRYTFTGGEPPGSYTWFGAVVPSGTTDVGLIEQKPFTVGGP